MSVTEVADVPVIANLAGDTQTYNEGDGAIVVDKSFDAVVTDVDSSNFDTGTLTVSIEAGSDNTEDVLAIANKGVGSGQVGVRDSDVTFEGTVIGTFTGGGSGSDLVITFDADARPVAVSSLVQAITMKTADTFHPTSAIERFVLS